MLIVGQNAAKEVLKEMAQPLDFNGIKLRLVLKVSKAADGFTAKLDRIDQGANDLN